MKTRLVVSIAAVLAIILAALVTVVTSVTGQQARADGLRYASSLASQNAEAVEVDLSRPVGTARDLAQTVGAMAAGRSGDRARADAVQRDLLTAHPEYLGVWAGFDPGAFDGQDSRHVGEANTDTTGRYVPYWFHDGSAVSLTPLTGYDQPGAGDYYLLPHASGKQVAIEPYAYEVAGKEVTMTSLAAPVRVGGQVVGVAGVDLSLASVTTSIAAIRPYGSGHALLVSNGGKVVASNRAADKAGSAPKGPAAKVAAEAVRSGRLVQRTVDTGSGPALLVAAPVAVGDGQSWALLVDIPMSAVLAGSHSLRTTILVVAAAAMLLAGLASLLVARGIVSPLDVLRRRMEEIADGDGDLTARVDESRKDEIGTLGASFNRFVAKVAGTVAGIGSASGSLSEVSAGMSGVSGRLVDAAERSAAQTQQVSAAAEQISRNVQTVAAGAEQMGASIREISSNAAHASRVGGDAVQAVTDTNATVAKLGDSSREIGAVVKTITSIAEQTNLLALNATIEAARAGEAGKGFAVVANEVKELAQETARATEDIARRVETIQADTTGAVDAMGRISDIIAQINDYQTTIASAVEEQTATTNEMSRSISEAAQGTGSIVESISGIAAVSAETSDEATQARAAAEGLAKVTADLSRHVGQFKV